MENSLIERIIADATICGFKVSRLSNGAPVLKIEGFDGRDTLAIVSGLHGDERSGPKFIADLLLDWRQDPMSMPTCSMVIVPLVNTEGWDKETRECNGVDLNREFVSTTQRKEILELMRALSDNNVGVFWDIHEDSETSYEYVFVKDDDTCYFTEQLAACLDAKVEYWSGEDGSAECFARSLGIARSVTTEIPPNWSLSAKMRWLRRAFQFVVGAVYRTNAKY